MREELEEVLELYEGMPQEGQEHWRARSLPSVKFQSEAEREEFVTALRERDRQPSVQEVETGGAGVETGGSGHVFRPGQRVKVNLAGLFAGGVMFSGNVEAAYATIREQVSADPPVYRVDLLFSFRGVQEVDVPGERVRPL
jgi:hypothetical protein